MKVVYTCEHCGKRFDNEKDALACEKAHEEEAARKAKLNENKKARAQEIVTDAKALMAKIDEFNKDYNDVHDTPYFNTLEKVFNSFFRF